MVSVCIVPTMGKESQKDTRKVGKEVLEKIIYRVHLLDSSFLEQKGIDNIPIQKLLNFEQKNYISATILDISEIISREYLLKLDELKLTNDKYQWFLEYKELLNKYKGILNVPESIYDCYDKEEVYLMQKCIETETYQADFVSKCNVASVILNRLENENFSDDVYKIIIPEQFAYGRKTISEDTILALEYAFMVEDTTNGALFFENKNSKVHESYADYIFTDSVGHKFFK